MNRILKATAAIALAATTVGASAQVSNTVYFDKYNFRQHHLNPAFIPHQKFYISIIGNVAGEFGNNSLRFNDVVKNIKTSNGNRTALFLDKDANGQKDFLKALKKNEHIYGNIYVDLIDFGFRIGDRNYLSFSVGVKAGADAFIPKKIFEVALDGMEKGKTFDLDAGSIFGNGYLYAEYCATFARRFNDRLNLGATIKILNAAMGAKTDFKSLTTTMNENEWIISGDAEVMMSYPGLKITQNEDNELDFDTEDDIKASDFKNSGLALDLGGTYLLTDKLTLAASITDFGFIKYKKGVGSVVSEQDFVYDGGEYHISSSNSEFKDGIDYDNVEDAFNNTFVPGKTSKFFQSLTTKVYLGASYDFNKMLSAGLLSKTSILGGKAWEEISLSANFHPIQMVSINGMYSMFNGKWTALGLGTNLNLGPINFFVAVDNIPFHFGKSKGDDSDNFIFPDRKRNTRFNVGFGLVFGGKKKKDLDEPIDDIVEEPEPDFFDADGDGVEDSRDKCADTEPGIEVDKRGCPLDTDGDGVPDYLDQCPETPAGVQVDSNGCPLDADSDGVPDYMDVCDNTPQGVQVNETGCPIDTDKDGVPDYQDKCPDVPGIAANNGCPEVKQEVKQLFRKALNGIQFASGKATILKSSYKILDDIAKTMKDNPEYNLFIKGQTDNVGKADMNLRLSKDRAESVRKYLIDKGIPEDRMHSEGYGDTMPVVPNNTSANRAKNRRVEFEVEF